MGRAMLFLVTGSFIIFGMIEMGLFGKQASMNELNVQAALNAQARNVANSGLERALNRLVTEENWRVAPNTPHRFAFGEEFADVAVVDGSMNGIDLPPGIVEVRSTGTSGNRVATATARLMVESGLPEIHGTMGIFTNNLSVNIAGSAFLIDGNDNNPTDPGLPLPGIAVNSQAAYDEFMKLNAGQLARIQGAGSTNPSLLLNTDMDGNALEDFVQLAIANADAVYVNHTASGPNSLGSVTDPKIIVVEGKLEIRNASGAGIIVIKEGGSLDARGNLDSFQGLIIVQGKADLTRGNIHIQGAMLFGGSNPTIEIDIDFRGNVNILYDSAALANLSTSMPQTAGTRQRLVGIFD